MSSSRFTLPLRVAACSAVLWVKHTSPHISHPRARRDHLDCQFLMVSGMEPQIKIVHSNSVVVFVPAIVPRLEILISCIFTHHKKNSWSGSLV